MSELPKSMSTPRQPNLGRCKQCTNTEVTFAVLHKNFSVGLHDFAAFKHLHCNRSTGGRTPPCEAHSRRRLPAVLRQHRVAQIVYTIDIR